MKNQVKLNQKGNLAKLIQRLKKLQSQQVELGYFSEQPNHYTGDSYASIMAYHEFGNALVVPQPVMNSLANYIKTQATSKTSPVAVELKMLINKDGYSAEDVLDGIGQSYAVYTYQNIFGASPPLEIVNNPTPMVDTGELSENFAWKTTLNMQYKTVG